MADMMKFVLRLGWFRIPFAIEVPDPDSAGGNPNEPGTPAYYAQVASQAEQSVAKWAIKAEQAANAAEQAALRAEVAAKQQPGGSAGGGAGYPAGGKTLGQP